MANPAADIRAALAEAIEDSEFPTDESREAADARDFEAEGADGAESASAAGDGNESGKDDAETDEETSEASDGTDDIPDEYFGVSLKDLPREQAKSIFEALTQQDTYIHKLQERLAKEPEALAPAPDDPDDGDVTDEALLQVLGFDPEDWETQQLAPKILPLARTILSLEEKVDAMVQKDTTREVETQWNSQLNELENTYGKLPFERVKVLQYAIEEGIASPFEAYFRMSAPAKKEVDNAVAKARQLGIKQAEGGGVKPRATAAGSAVIDPKTTSMRDAVRIAMAETEKETGLKFKNLFGRKVKTGE